MTQLSEQDELLASFLDEALYLVRGLPCLLDTFREQPENLEPLHGVFRAVHSIKGTSGYFDLPEIQRFSHELENTLDQLRHQKLALREPLHQALLHGLDLFQEMLLAAQASQYLPALDDRITAILKEIETATTAVSFEDKETRLVELARLLADMKGSGLSEAEDWATRLQQLMPRGYQPPAAALASPSLTAIASGSSTQQRFVRVKQEQLDALSAEVSVLANEFEQVSDVHHARLVTLQASVVALGTVSAAALLTKFSGFAGSLAARLGKELEVVLYGTEVAIQRSLVEELDAPLTHMVSNVCDHALETPTQRRAAGKREAGRLRIGCETSDNKLVVTVEDDGRGIDTERLRVKAVIAGLLTADQAAELSEEDALQLMFHPGLSTAERVTDISGRGVGLDVVRAALRQRDGEVTVTSRVGVGTTFRLSIPRK